MRIMFIVDSLSHGGAGRVVSILADSCDKSGFETSVLVTAEKSSIVTSYIQNKDVQILYLLDNYNGTDISPLKRISGYRSAFIKNKPDVVVAFLNEIGEYTVLASMFMNHKIIISERIDPHMSPTNAIMRILRNPLYNCADKLVFQTNDMRDFFPKAIQDKSIVIFNPVSPELPRPYFQERDKRIVSVGRLAGQKNYPMAIEAYARFNEKCPEYSYEIYGDGPLKHEIEEMIDSLSLQGKVKLMGHVPDVTEKIRTATMFVMTSDYEGLSNSLIEAMAMGMPCISTDHPIGDARMLIKSGSNGFLVPVGDSSALSTTMIELAKDPQLQQAVGKEAVLVRDMLSVETISQKWIKLCKSLVV